jgi:N-acetylglucosamine kinase-like BadF-type ATPase
MSKGFIVGVDGGGTKTTAMAEDFAGNVIHQASTGPSNYNFIGFENACKAIEKAITDVLQGERLAALCLGLAGVGRQDDVDRFQAWAHARFPNIPLSVVNDAQILLAAGKFRGAGLALVCGTGSIVYGRTVDEKLVRAGGWGYLFGDEGSGYAIGAAALRSVMWAQDGRGKPTQLTGLILERRGLKAAQELIRSIYGAEAPRAEIAGLADLVERAAAQQDEVARSILDQAARDLAITVQAAYWKLGTPPVPLAITGGTILNGVYLAAAFWQACKALNLVFSTVTEVKEPAEGALLIARQLLR